MTTIVLKADVEKKLLNFYPWVYADEIGAVNGPAGPGEIVDVTSARGEFIGRAFFNSESHIQARMLTVDPGEKFDREFFDRRLRKAQARRAGRVAGTNGMRLVYAEADELPGLVVDRFADTLVIQLRNPGLERFRDEIVRSLKRIYQPTGIYERSDTQARLEEGLPPAVGLVWGEVPERIDVVEDDIHFSVSVRQGQKTGFYLDQRENRRLLDSMVKTGDRVLDVYSYTGGFSLHAGRSGAEALAVDKDAEALRTLEENLRFNHLEKRVGARWGDAFEVLGDLKTEGRLFTHVVLDPPTLAKHKNDVLRVKQLFSELVGAALAVLAPGGILFQSTCAYHITASDLVEAARRAANDTHRVAQVLTLTYQPADHPWILQVPETLYLKTLVLRVM
jgi:23S rRNA (cytosine1962-C5)-methyltransferase